MKKRATFRALAAVGVMLAVLCTGGVAQAATILFIGGSATPTAGADAAVMTYLQGRYGAGNVTYQRAGATSAGDELAFDALVASSTPGSGDIRNKFQNSTTGVVNWEEAVVDSGSGEFQLSIVNKPGGKTQINITDNAHQITSGFSTGLTTIFTGGSETIAQNGAISAGVQVLATEDNSTDATLFVADTGAALFGDGSAGRPNVAAGRRVTFPITDSSFNNLNADGQMLFGSSVDWAAGIVPVPPSLAWYSPLDGNADATVGGVDGALNGNTAATADRNGTPNAALVFDGNGDNVVIDKSTLPASFTEGSITAWARIDDGANDDGVVGVGGSGGAGVQYFNLLLSGGGDNVRTDVDRGAGGDLDRKDALGPAMDADWHHLAMSFVAGDGADALKLYIDGVEVDSETLNGLTPVTPTNNWTIGSDRLTSRYFDGAIDDVAIWSTALTGAEIFALANGSETPMSLAFPPAAGDIPEPMTMLAVGLGIAGLGGYIRRRRRA